MSDGEPYLIYSIEHGAWWKPGRYGYTPDVLLAGLYNRAAAIEICAQANRYLPPPALPNEVPVRLDDAMTAELFRVRKEAAK